MTKSKPGLTVRERKIAELLRKRDEIDHNLKLLRYVAPQSQKRLATGTKAGARTTKMK